MDMAEMNERFQVVLLDGAVVSPVFVSLER